MNNVNLQKPLAALAMMIAILVFGTAMTIPRQMASNKTAAEQDEADLLGTWTGESICQVKSSPCHDEKAIYRISKAKDAGKVTIDLGKIVNGEAETMGVLDFSYDPKTHTLLCEFPRGVWKFVVTGNKMEGTLTTTDGVLYRRISLKKNE